MPDQAEKTQKIADNLVLILQEWLTEAEWAEMQKLNAAEPMPDVCHSHDFCDANMAMAEAFRIVTHHEVNGDNEDDCYLWNTAWELAMPELKAKVAA